MCDVLQGTLSVMALNVTCVAGYFVCHSCECDVLQGTLSVTAVRRPAHGTPSKKTLNSFLTKLIARNGNIWSALSNTGFGI